MTDEKKEKNDILDDIEGAFKVATKFVGVADPIARALGRAAGHLVPPPNPAPSPPPPTFDPKCYTCGDTLKVGAIGHERPCPACVVEQVSVVRSCPTCGGSGKVGNPGHQATCPVCKGKGA